MQRRPLYSRSGKLRSEGRSPWVAPDGISPVYLDTPAADQVPSLRQRMLLRLQPAYRRHQGVALVATSVIVTLLLVGAYTLLRPPPQDLSQGRLTAAVNYAIDHRPEAPAATTVAYAKIIPSVVRVDGYDPLGKNSSGSPDERGTGPDSSSPGLLHSNNALPGYEN